MKTILPFVAALSVSVVVPLHAESTLQTSAYRNSIAQDELRKRADDVRQQLLLLLEDIRQNQENTPESELASRTAKKLLSLGDDQLLPLVQSLKNASTAEDPTNVLSQLTDASKEQKNVLILLKSMADGLTLYKDQATIQQRLQQLVLRQVTNIRQTRDIAATGKPAEIASLCQSEQAALAREVDTVSGTLQRIADDTTDDSRKTNFAAALQAMKTTSVPALAAAAAAETEAGRYPAAIVAQNKLLDGLQSVLAKLNASLPPQERARNLAAQLAALASQQEAIAKSSHNAPDSTQRDKQESQSLMADKIAAIQQEVQDLDAKAAGLATQARKEMEKAAEALKNPSARNDEENSSWQTASANTLKRAAEELNRTAEQLDKVADPQNAAQALADLARLSQKVTDAQAMQNALGANPSSQAEQQKDLTEKTESLQREALSRNEKAAQNLGNAAEAMRSNDSQQASQALAEANAEIQAQMQAVSQVAAREQQMRAVSNKIAEARAATAEALKEMQSAQPGQAQMAAIKKSEEAEAVLEQARQTAAVTGASDEVKSALQQARAALEKSKLEAAQKKADAAMQSNLSAQDTLDSAMQSIQRATSNALANALKKQPSTQQAASSQSAQQMNGGRITDGKAGDATGLSTPGGAISTGTQPIAVNNSTGLKPKEREAVALLQKESAPPEYQGMSGQYLKNLGQGLSPATPLPQ